MGRAYCEFPLSKAPSLSVVASLETRLAGDYPMNELAAPLRGLRILIVEDDAVIALDCQQLLLDAGADRVELARSLAEATNLLAVQVFDIAVIDIYLGTETGLPIASVMTKAGIPFIFCSGASRDIDLPLAVRHVPLISKPFGTLELVTCIHACAISVREQP